MTPDMDGGLRQAIARLGRGVIYFLGNVDTGKTTFIAALANELVEQEPITILDADIGQSSILPLTITLLLARKRFHSLAGLTRVKQDFIPGYNLVLNRERNAEIMGRFAGEARRWSSYCLIDTTGFVLGPGVMVKQAELEHVQPDLVVALQREDELSPLLAGIDRPVLHIPVHAEASIKSETERQERRNLRLARYFRRAGLRRLPSHLADEVPVYSEDCIVGLYDEEFLGLGIVERITGSHVLLRTPVEGNVRHIEFTPVRFSMGRER